MSIFNSLGSNYSAGFTLKRLLGYGSTASAKRLESALTEHYGGRASLIYKGRQALELALKRSGLPSGSAVGINGFTCYVVYQAVKNAGYKPVFIDVAHGQMDFDLEQLKNTHTQHRLSGIIIQNTLGYPVNMTAIKPYAQEQKIAIIEDLAHSLGAFYDDGQEAGKVGAFTMMSFSQDKPLDVVAGGALIERQTPATANNEVYPSVSLRQRLVNRTYPLLSGLIRATYPLGFGKIIHFALRKLHLMATPMSDNLQDLHGMDKSAASLLLQRWEHRIEELQHRQNIANIYLAGLPKSLRPFELRGKPTYLRFALWVDDRSALVEYLKSHGIYVGDTWYDAPIAPKRYLKLTDYRPGQCLQAESLAAHIVNLPTHIHVSEATAKRIVELINDWLPKLAEAP